MAMGVDEPLAAAVPQRGHAVEREQGYGQAVHDRGGDVAEHCSCGELRKCRGEEVTVAGESLFRVERRGRKRVEAVRPGVRAALEADQVTGPDHPANVVRRETECEQG